MNKFSRNNYFVFFFVVILPIMIYWRWFFDFSILTHGDWGFFFKETQKDFFSFPYIWSGFSLGSIYITLSFYLSSFYTGILYYIDNFPLSERLVYFWPAVLIASAGSYFLAKKILNHTISAIIASFVFSYNTYFLLINTAHLTLSVAFALVPFILYFFIRSLEEKSFFYGTIVALLGFISSTYDFRSFYIISFVLFFYFLFFLFFIEKKNFIKNSVHALFPIIIVSLLSFFWVFGLFQAESIASNEIFDRNLFGNDFMNVSRSMALFHPFWTGYKVQFFVIQSIPYYFYLIPLFAFLGLLLNKKNKNILFFGFISLLGILLSKQVAEPFPSIYQWLFENFPGFNAFREASKFYFLIALGYSILIGSFIKWIWYYCGKNRWEVLGKYILIFFVVMIFLWNTKPIVTGEIGSIFEARYIPNDYSLFKDFILEQNQFFRTLWIPSYSRWSFYSNINPKIDGVEIAGSHWKNLMQDIYERKNFSHKEKIVGVLKQEFSEQLLNISSIKYVIIPLQDIANDDDFFIHYGERQFFVDMLDKISYLEKVDIGIQDLVVYENKNFRPHIYKTKEKETIYKDISYENIEYTFKNPTEYDVVLKNVSEPLFVNFSESYHPDWRLRIGNFHWWEVLWDKGYFLSEEYHSENDAKLSSFYIDPYVICKEYACTNNADGARDIELTLYFKPQSYVYMGLIVSGTTFVGCLGYLGWYGMRKSKWFRKKEYE